MKIKHIVFILLLAAGFSAAAQTYSASNFTLISTLDPETGFNADNDKYSGCWGWYQASKNKEYAIAGSQSGTFWVDISNPATPTVSAYRAGTYNGAIWREIKTYQNYCYVISDDYSGANSLQIFDMQYLPDSVSKVYDSQALFERAHTLWVDGTKLYVAGITYSNNTTSSMNVYSLANPASPTLLRRLNQDYSFISYVHDMHVRRDTVFASCGYQGLYMFKFNSNNTFTQLGSLTGYPYSGYNHSSSWTPNGQTLVFTDEVPDGLPIKVANTANLANLQVLATTNQFTQTTPHNPFVVNNQYCFVSSYQEGLQLYDISSPASPVLAGFFDTFPQGGGNINNWGTEPYDGQWGAYPYFPSKIIFALDMLNGIFLLKTDLYQNSTVASSFTVPASICEGKSFMASNTSTGATNYTWTLNGANTATSSLGDPTFTVTAPGVYSVTLLASNPSYSASSTQTITVLANPQSTLSFPMLICSSCGVITSTVSGGVAPYTYSWTPSGGTAATANSLTAGCYTVTITDANGCRSTNFACQTSVVNLQSYALNSGPKIYPNPAQSFLNIDYAGKTFSYSLHNNLGQLVTNGFNLQEKAGINLEGLPAGIYLLQLQAGKETLQQKIMVQH